MVCIRPALYTAHTCLLSLLLHTKVGTLAMESLFLVYLFQIYLFYLLAEEIII